MKVLIFGGTGWVGHTIAGFFIEDNHDVTICSRGEKKTFSSVIEKAKFLKADKSVECEVEKIFAENKYDYVIDSVPTEKTIDYIYKYAKGLKHYLHCSSTGGYAPLPFIPCNETAYYEGYAAGWKSTKKVVDNKVLDLFNRRGFPATVIRPCYITGIGMLPLDNQGGRRTDFISDIIAGKVLDLPNDGQSLLQPIHVEDLAHSFLLAAANGDKSKGQVYNICLEKAVTLNNYLEINAAVFNTKPVINYISLEEMVKKYGDTINETGLRFMALHMCFDIFKAKEQIGYFPEYTTEQAIEETALWASKQRT